MRLGWIVKGVAVLGMALSLCGAAAEPDSTAYLQSLLDSDATIPPGTYFFTTLQTGHGNRVLRGSGKENTRLVQLPYTNANGVECYGARHFAVTDLTLDGNGDRQTTGNGIGLHNCASSQIRNVNLFNIHGSGVIAQKGSSDCFFDNIDGYRIGYHLLSISDAPRTRVGFVSGREIGAAVINLAASPASTLGQIFGENAAPNGSGYGGVKISNASDDTVVGSIHVIGFGRGLFIKDSSNVLVGHIRASRIAFQCILIQAEIEGARADNNVVVGSLLQDCGLLSPDMYGVHFAQAPEATSAAGNRIKGTEIRDPARRLLSAWRAETTSLSNSVTP